MQLCGSFTRWVETVPMEPVDQSPGMFLALVHLPPGCASLHHASVFLRPDRRIRTVYIPDLHMREPLRSLEQNGAQAPQPTHTFVISLL